MKTIKVILVLILLYTTSSICVFAQEVFQEKKGRFSTGMAMAMANLAKGGKVVINSAGGLSGKLHIKTGNTDRAVFEYKKFLKVTSKSEAIDYSRVIDVTIDGSSSGVEIFLRAPNPAPWAGTNNSGVIEGELTLPPGCCLDIDAVYFDLFMEGPFRSVRIEPSFGRVDIKKVTNDLNLETSNRDIKVGEISGNISIITSHADIRIEDMQSGSEPAYIKNENGGLFINRFTGAFNIKNNFGRIKLENLKLISDRSRISCSYSPIRLEVIELNEAGLTIRNTNEDVEMTIIETASADFSLRVDSNGEIDTEGFAMKPTLIDNNRLDFITGFGDNRIRISISGKGNIDVKGIKQ